MRRLAPSSSGWGTGVMWRSGGLHGPGVGSPRILGRYTATTCTRDCSMALASASHAVAFSQHQGIGRWRDPMCRRERAQIDHDRSGGGRREQRVFLSDLPRSDTTCAARRMCGHGRPCEESHWPRGKKVAACRFARRENNTTPALFFLHRSQPYEYRLHFFARFLYISISFFSFYLREFGLHFTVSLICF